MDLDLGFNIGSGLHPICVENARALLSHADDARLLTGSGRERSHNERDSCHLVKAGFQHVIGEYSDVVKCERFLSCLMIHENSQ